MKFEYILSMLNHNLLKLLLLFLPTLSYAYVFEDDVPQPLRQQVRDDLRFVGNVEGEGNSGLHMRIFGAVSGEIYDQFFRKRVKTIGVNGCQNPYAIACVIPSLDPSKIWLNDPYMSSDYPQIARLMTLFHESRHTEVENGSWPHAVCPEDMLTLETMSAHLSEPILGTRSNLGGARACDNTVYGSYALALIMAKNISKYCTNCGSKMKMDASIYAEDKLARIVGEEARQEIVRDLFSSDTFSGDQFSGGFFREGRGQNPAWGFLLN